MKTETPFRLCQFIRIHTSPAAVLSQFGHDLAWSWARALIAARQEVE